MAQPNETTEDLLSALRKAHAAEPDDPQATCRLAEHYADRGWLHEALEMYREALTKNADDFFLLLSCGNACCRRQDYAVARDVFTRCTVLRPDRVEGWNNAGIVHMTMGTREGARESFTRALELEPDNAGTLLNLGNCFADLGEPDKAKSIFERALKFRPDFADAWFNLGNLQYAAGRYGEARTCFERAIRYKREFPSAQKNLGVVFERLGEWTKAADCDRAAAELDKTDAGSRINLANVFIAEEKFEAAANSFKEAVRLAPRNVRGWLGLRYIALLKGDMPTLRACNARNPAAAGRRNCGAERRGPPCARPQRRCPPNNRCGYRCGKKGDDLDAQRILVYQVTGGNEERTARIYSRLSSLAATSASIRKSLAFYDLRRENVHAAISRIEENGMVDREMQYLLVRALLAAGDGAGARGRLAEYRASRPLDGELSLLAARVAAEDNDTSRAKALLLQAVVQGTDSTDLLDAEPGLRRVLDGIAA